MGVGHDHTPSAAEVGQAPDFRKKLWIAFSLTAFIVVVQAVGSVITGSMALLTDTVLALTDAALLLVLLIARLLPRKTATGEGTWWFRPIEVMAALGQASLLLIVVIYAAIEGIRRLTDPPEGAASELLIFGVLGLTANVVSLVVLA